MSNFAESSLLLWALSALTLLMSAVVCLGWTRQAQSTPRWRDNWLACVIAGVSLGTGLCAAIVLSLSAEALPFPLGYRWLDVPLLWLGSCLICMLAMAWLANSASRVATIGAGVMVALATVAGQFGWANAIGFRPGLQWDIPFVAVGAMLILLGVCIAIWLALSEASRYGRRRSLWRLGSALLLTLSVVAGQEVLMSGSNLLAQVGSIYRRDVPAPLLSMALGVVVPLVLLVMLFDLRMLRSQQRRTRHREARDRRTEAGAYTSGLIAQDSKAASPAEPHSQPPLRTAPR